jgi:hypothetical protein
VTPPAQYAVQSQRLGEVSDRTHDLSLSDIVVSSKCCVASERLRHDQPDSECANFTDSFYKAGLDVPDDRLGFFLSASVDPESGL